MSLEKIGRESYELLKDVEQSTERVILAEFSDLEKRIRKELSSLLTEMAMLKKAGETIPVSFFAKQNRLNLILKNVSDQIKKSAILLGIAQKEANKKAVKIAGKQVEKQFELTASTFQPNIEAGKNLISRAQDNTPLRKFYERIDAPVRDRLKQVLLNSVISGKSADQTASEIKFAVGTGRNHALMIARTELNQSFRGATLDHFENNKSVIKGYIWQSALDIYTCPICWGLHGKIFKTKDRFLPHPNCRCTLLAYFGGDSGIKTGSDVFKDLSEQQQLAILGKGRFEHYKNGVGLEDFSAVKESEFGKIYYLKNLGEMAPKKSGKTKPAKPAPPAPAPTKKAPAPAVGSKTAAKVLPKPNTSQEAFEQMKKASAIYDKKIAKLKDLIDKKMDLIKDSSPDSWNEVRKLFDGIDVLRKEQKKALLDVLRVENPTEILPKIKKGFKPKEEIKLKEAIADFNSLVDKQFLDQKTFPFNPIKKSRAYHQSGSIHLPSFNVKPATVIHELSHALEQQGKGILENVLEFYEHRTKGESEQLLSKLTGIKEYGKEKAKPDKFFSPYVGKVYQYPQIDLSTGNLIYKIRATEIISMGVERYYKDPFDFASDDPEYFDFIFKILRGIKWKPK